MYTVPYIVHHKDRAVHQKNCARINWDQFVRNHPIDKFGSSDAPFIAKINTYVSRSIKDIPKAANDRVLSKIDKAVSQNPSSSPIALGGSLQAQISDVWALLHFKNA